GVQTCALPTCRGALTGPAGAAAGIDRVTAARAHPRGCGTLTVPAGRVRPAHGRLPARRAASGPPRPRPRPVHSHAAGAAVPPASGETPAVTRDGTGRRSRRGRTASVVRDETKGLR